MCGKICGYCSRSIEDHPLRGSGYIDSKAHQQKQYYDQKIGIVNLKPSNLVLVKADAFKQEED